MMSTQGKYKTGRKKTKKKTNVKAAQTQEAPPRLDRMDVSSKLAFCWKANRHFIHLIRGQRANMAI